MSATALALSHATLLADHTTTTVLADDIFDMSNNLTAKVVTLLGEVTLAGAMIFVLKHIAQSFTVVRLVTALLLGGGMVWGVLHLQDLSKKVDNTVNQDGGGSSTTGGPGEAPPQTTTQLGAGEFRIIFPDDPPSDA